MAEHSPRRTLILERATPLFQQLGYAKTTLVDVARAAGISRPTLYAEFPDKLALYEAVMAVLVGDLLATIDAKLVEHTTLRAQMLFACRTWVASGHSLVAANPEVADLFDPHFEAVRAGDRAFEGCLAGIFARFSVAPPSPFTVERLSETVSHGLQGLKRFADSAERLDELVETLVDAICVAATSAR